MHVKKTFFSLLIALSLLSACDPFNTTLTEKDVIYYTSSNAQVVPVPDTLMIMTWNIKFGGARIDFFYDCFGDRVIMTEEEVLNNMAGIAEKIKQVNPDIIYLQEVDINSKRSAMVDQVQYLLDQTDLNYGVYASQWRSDWVPKKGLGQINSGNLILSRWKLTDAKRIALPLFEEQNSIVRYFYLRRNVLEAKVHLDDQNLHLINTHLSAYSHDGTKKKQLDIVNKRIREKADNGIQFLLGGDFNCLPPGSKKVMDFPDSECVEDFVANDYSTETEWMVPLYDFESAIHLDEYQKNNEKHFSHTVDSPERGAYWNKKLDYLFTNQDFVDGSGQTHQDEKTGMNTMKLSDHCPVTVRLLIK
jgi:endonuclease/exonuclease/phosphatase family metal-dependent hydrolase